MLRSLKDLEDYAIGATDGSVGHVTDFLFDDEAWLIRYFVVKTGGWLSNRKVLISPNAIQLPNWAERLLLVSITKEQVKNSPDIDTDKPVSRQHEVEYLGYYGYPYYWGGGSFPYAKFPPYDGSAPERRGMQEENDAYEKSERDRHRNDDPHLRSCKAIIGYHIHATDGEVGHVSGLFVDEQNWVVRYLVIDTGKWWAGHKVLIAPEWIDQVSWTDKTVSIDLTQRSVKDAPLYDSSEQLSRQLEIGLYQHYERSGYWSDVRSRNP